MNDIFSGSPVTDRALLDHRSDFLFTCPGLSFLPTLFFLPPWQHHTVTLILVFIITYNPVVRSLMTKGLRRSLLVIYLASQLEFR